MSVAFLILLLYFTTNLNAQNRGGQSSMSEMPNNKLETKARVATVEDDSSVRALIDEVFAFPHVFGRLPGVVEVFMKERLFRAEIAYRLGTRAGVEESDVAQYMNLLVDKLQLPEYAKTSSEQVRVLRMTMLFSTPQFMGQGIHKVNAKVGDTLSPTMSPVQAAHLIGTLIDQKFLNPQYQLTPEEWKRLGYQEQLRPRPTNESQRMKHRVTVRENPKRFELQQAFSKATNTMSVADTFELVEEAFRTLHLGL
jgi:hypothetical protein